MQDFTGQRLDAIRIEPDVVLFLEYSEPDQGGTRLLQRFYISLNKLVEVETGYSHEEKYISRYEPITELPSQVSKDSLEWIARQLETSPTGKLQNVLKRFQKAITSI